MTQNIHQLKFDADSAKLMYQRGAISREKAKEMIMPYINLYNEKSQEIAKKHGMKAKKINFCSYVR